jgi:sodium-dependent dicarboxylate transporter 2/3/5
MGIAPARDVFAPFADPLIFLFIGSFILAQSIFVYRLNERIAFGVMSWKIIRGRPSRILIAYGVIAFLISMWISNTATAAMLAPIGLSLLTFMRTEAHVSHAYTAVLMLTTSYGASLGGSGTPVGTAPNLITIGMIDRFTGVHVSFFQWSVIGLTVGGVLMAMSFVYFGLTARPGVQEIAKCDAIVRERSKSLGRLKRGEKNVAFAFVVTVLLWIVPGVLTIVLGADHPSTRLVSNAFPESVAAIIGALLLLVLPVSPSQRSTLTWKQAADIDWGTILIFGSGIALGGLAFSTKLAEVVGRSITGLLPTTSVFGITFAAALFGVLIGEVMSHTAASNIAVPIVISIAKAAGVDSVAPAIATCLAMSAGLALPVSTPPNAIVYASGQVPITTMVRHGVVIGLVGLLVVPVLVSILVPLVIGTR